MIRQPDGYESPALTKIELPVHYKNLAGALLGLPERYPSHYSATYATALAPKGYTLDGLTCIISGETFLNIQALLAGPYRFTQPWPVRGPRSNQIPEREWYETLVRSARVELASPAPEASVLSPLNYDRLCKCIEKIK